jgi:NADH-dependent peroxiredoxin subunit F
LGILGDKEFENKGVVYCSTCDAPMFGGKDVVVVGGGNAALESAIDLQKYANKIYVLVRSDKIRGDALLYEQAQKGGKTEFLFNCEPREIQGSNFMEKVLYYDKSAGQMKELAASGLFVNVGWVPATGFLNGTVELSDYKEIKINPHTNETSVKGIFAAGDCTDLKYKQIIIACGEGAKAALSAYEYTIKLK